MMEPSFFAPIAANFLIIIGVVGAGIFAISGFGTGIHRFYGYGLITLVIFVFSHFFAISLFWPVMILSIVITVNGSVLLVRFVRKYPKEEGEMIDVETEE